MTAPRLIVVAHAVAPGPGGPESQVNLEFLRALARCWPAGVSVISGGGPPALRDGTPFAALPGWRVHALGESGAASGGIHRLAAAAVRSLRRGGLPARAAEWLIHRRTGQGIKLASWQRAASRALERELDLDPGAVVYSRALPFASVAAVDTVRRRRCRRSFRWLVNVNDPLPAGVWPGLYARDAHAERRTRERLAAAIPHIDAVTFPSAALRDLELAAFPALAQVPSEVLPHIAAAVPTTGAAPASGRLRLAFAGTLRKDRARPELAAALARLPAVCADLEISFHLARRTPVAESYAASLPVATRIVREEGEDELARSLAAADVLLDLESEADRPLLLTKVVSYLAAGRPLWALCAPEGTTWSLVHEDGWGYASRLGDVESTVETLLCLHGDWSRRELAARAASPELLDRFSAWRQIDDLLRLLGRLAP